MRPKHTLHTMPLTPEQLAKIRQKDANTPDALKRNPLNDYTEGWFHVTLNVRGEAPVLGYIVGDATAPDGSANAPRCVLTELGRKVEEVWRGVSHFHPMCTCDIVLAMPEHIHALLHLLPGNTEHLGRIINGLMIGSSHGYWDTLGIPWRKMRAEKDAAASDYEQDKALRAQWQDRDHTRSYRGPALFERGYNDVEAIGADEIEIKRQYIRNNPRKRLIKRDRPDLFCVHRNRKSPNWTPERIMCGLCADRCIAADRNKQIDAWLQVTTHGIINSRGKMSATLNFSIPDAGTAGTATAATATATAGTATAATTTTIRPTLDLVGNMQLLSRPLFPLICHRADAQRFEQQKAAVLRVAREQGGVIVTACVSPKEREIVKLLQQELLPVIEVMAYGFNDRYKPTGRAFYAVAEQRRLEVSPWVYEYHPRELRPVVDAQGAPVLDASGQPVMEEVPDISREMCMVMNELVRMIAKMDDGWWKG